LITDSGYRKELSEKIRQHWGNHSLLSIINVDRKKLMSEYIGESVKKELLDIMNYISSMVIIDNDNSNLFGNSSASLSGKIDSEKVAELDMAESILNKFFTRLYSHTEKVEFKRRNDGDSIRYKLVFHRKINGQIVEIDADNESAGTLHLLGLVRPILASVTGSVVFIDELDNGIHDNLLIDLVEQIIPHIKGQLVCTTHESMLLDVISPANAFVIQVDGNGNKNIASIASLENVHKNNSVQKRFLGGRYMGVPIPTMLMLDEIVEDFHEGDIWRNLG
jgi:AAA15 family ATPase/GTPase